MPEKPKPDFTETFFALRDLLTPYAPHLNVSTDTAEAYHLNAGYCEKWKQVLYFGGVHLRKSYVSYYLMPIYVCPELVNHLSDRLQARRQGKSCFNFKTPDPELLAELGELTRLGFEHYQSEGFLSIPTVIEAK